MELAQNAADADGGRFDLQYDGSVLSAANTGAPLTADGVAALASLRASAKRGGRTVGRFGVGFAAVAAVADDVVVTSTSGTVRFSRALTLEAVRSIPSLAAELSARGGRVPLLRLPFAAEASPRAGFDTEVRLTVRPDADPLVRAMLDAVDPTLLLVLPGLSSLTVQGRELVARTDGDDVLLDGVRWRVVRGSGSLDPSLLKGRPVEEQAWTQWSVTWAVPLSEGLPAPLPPTVPAVLRAPTATDDPLSLPAVLAASLPLGPDRRRVLPGPLTEAVLGHAGRLLAELVEGLPPDPARLSFVPGPLAAGEIDAMLGSAVLQAFRAGAVLGARPADSVVLVGANPALVALLEELLPLLPHPWSAARWAPPLRVLAVRRMSLAELTELLASVDRPAAWWGRLYAALPPDVEQLGALPVPVVGGGLAPSPRGLLVADAAVDLSPLGFRVVEPDAAHDLLLRLGAQHAEPRALLEDPRVRAAVEAAADEDGWDDDGTEPVVQAVLALVGAADLRPGELPWLAALPLPTTDGDARPAGELLLPDGPLASVVDVDAGFGVVAAGVAHPDVLAAVGVLRTFAVVPAEEAEDADGVDAWLASLRPGEEPGPVVRDLDLVRGDAWPRALALLEAGDLLTPYTLWWLKRHPVLGGQRPDALRLRGSDPVLDGLLDVADHPLAARLGAASSLADVDPALLLARLADEGRALTRAQVRRLHAHLAVLRDLPLPDTVRAVVDGELVVVPAEDAVVVDRPDLLARVAPYAVVPVPLALASSLADALDLSLASELLETPALQGDPHPWLEAPGGYVEHERIEVATAGGDLVGVAWVAVGDVDHVVGADGRARALAWRLGDWPRRHALLARFRGDPDQAESDVDPLS